MWNTALQAVKAPPEPNGKRTFFDLTKARHELDWLSKGSSAVQQQALRDLRAALTHAKNKTYRFPTRRLKGEHEGFCVRDVTVTVFNDKWAQVTVPKAGHLKFKLPRPLPEKYGWHGSPSIRLAGT